MTRNKIEPVIRHLGDDIYEKTEVVDGKIVRSVFFDKQARLDKMLARCAAYRKNAATIRSKPIFSILGVGFYFGDI